MSDQPTTQSNPPSGLPPLPPTRPQSGRLFWFVILGIALIVVIVAIGVLSALSSVAQQVANFNRITSTPVIIVTGTIERIAAMPLPPDATLTATMIRTGTGGTFDFTTRLRPQQVYDLYYYILTQRNRWQPGTGQVVEENYADFRFYPGTVPRLTIVKIQCDAEFCNVHVDY